MIGIYIIKNKITQQVYVGQSVNFNKRKSRHLKNLRDRNYKEHNKLYPAMIKYGVENFQFVFIEECLKEHLEDREKYWIDYYDSINNGYNLSNGSAGGLKYWKGKKRDIKTKIKISQKLKGIPLAEETKRKIGESNKKSMIGNKNGCKRVLCVELNKEFENIKSAAEYIGVNPSNISKCLKGVQKTAGKYTWKYL